jgi:hypothetical protein
MNARTITRVETNIERAAAALFAGAVGYAVHGLLDVPSSYLLPSTLASAVAAYLLCAVAMRALARPRSPHKVRVFDLREFEVLEPDELLLTEPLRDELVLTDSDRVDDSELLLTDADRLGSRSSNPGDPLVLDDVLAAVGEESRVVRLFDRKAIPTPGELSSTIERHLEKGPTATPGDAAQALSDALAELRRSLR